MKCEKCLPQQKCSVQAVHIACIDQVKIVTDLAFLDALRTRRICVPAYGHHMLHQPFTNVHRNCILRWIHGKPQQQVRCTHVSQQ